MATHTLRPTSLAGGDPPFPAPFQLVTPVGGTYKAPGLSDDSIATFWNFLAYQEGYRSYLAMSLDDLEDLDVGERIQSVRVRVRAFQGNDVPASSFLTSQLYLSGGTPPVLSELDVMARPADQLPTGEIIEGAAWTLAPDGEAWTAQKVADLRVAVYMEQYAPQAPQSWPQGKAYFSNPSRLYEVYVDVTTNVAPSTTISAPSGDQSYDDASTTKGSATLTSATAAFTTDDNGLALVGQETADDTFADGSGSFVLASATAAFSADDVGLEVQAGNALPAGAIVSEVIDATQARLSEAMRQEPRSVSDGYYVGPDAVRINTLSGSPIIWLSAPSYDRPFLDCPGVAGLGTDIGRRIIGPGIPEGATIVQLYNQVGTGSCFYAFFAFISANATTTVKNASAEMVSEVVESATAAFTADDVGALIYGGDLPSGATITDVLSATAVVISDPIDDGNDGADASISIARLIPATAPVEFTIRSRRAIPSGVTVTYVSATQVTLSSPAVLTLADQTFTLLGRPEVITDVDRPLIQVSFGDPEGNSVVAWMVKVFSAAQLAVAGFDPDTSEALHSSAELVPAGRSAEYRVTEALVDGTLHRFYAKAADAAGYGTWAFVDFTLAVPLPAVPTLSSVLPEDAVARVGLGVTADEGVADSFNRADSSSTMGSADTGEAWSPQSGTWGIASNKGRLVAAASRTVSDGVTYLPRVVDDGVTQIARVVTDGVTSVARTVTDGVTTVGRTVTDGATVGGRVVAGVYKNPQYDNKWLSAQLYGSPYGYLFSLADVGKLVTGTGIPGGTTIVSVDTPVSGGLYSFAEISGAGWSGSVGPITVTIGGNITVTSATAVFVAGDVGKPIAGGTLPLGTTIQSRTSATEVVTTATSATSETGLTIHIGGVVVTSATAVFVAGDVGKPISGGTIPGGATVVLRNSATSVQISLPATSAASSVSVTLAGTLLTSVTALFTADDVDKPITGTGIPASTKIASVAGSSSVILSAAVTGSGTGITVTVGLSTVVDSATAVFVAGDVGEEISGTGIPAGATIASRTSATRVVISAAVTEAGIGITLTIGTAATTVDSATGAFTSADLGKKAVGGTIPAGAVIEAVVSGTRVTVSAGATVAATAVSLTISGQESALVELGAVDVDAHMRVTLTDQMDVALRALNGTNMLFAKLAPGVLEIWKRQAGALTRLASPVAVSTVTGGTYDVVFRAEGRLLTAFIDGVEATSATLTFTEKTLFTGAGYTKGGPHTNGDTASRFDDFFAVPSALTVLAERSDDDGATWMSVRPAAGWLVTSHASLTTYDYEMPRRTDLRYRLRASRHSEAPVYSAGTAPSSVVEVAATEVWLKDPLDPSDNMTLVHIKAIDEDSLESTSEAAQSAAYANGRADPIVRSSAIRTEVFDGLRFFFYDNASYNAFEAMRAQQRTLLLQTLYGDDPAEQYYLRFGKRTRKLINTKPSHMATEQWRVATVEAVEVVAPGLPIPEPPAEGTWDALVGSWDAL